MKVHASTRRKALLDIFLNRRKPRGGVLSARDLERDWKRTGLRRSDLELALRDMTLHHLLLLRRAHDGLCYELTYLGERAMQLPLLGGPVTAVQDWMTLRRAKRRDRGAVSATTQRNRRSEDRPDAAAGDKPPSTSTLATR